MEKLAFYRMWKVKITRVNLAPKLLATDCKYVYYILLYIFIGTLLKMLYASRPIFAEEYEKSRFEYHKKCHIMPIHPKPYIFIIIVKKYFKIPFYKQTIFFAAVMLLHSVHMFSLLHI
jgi:hypothetical protein